MVQKSQLTHYEALKIVKSTVGQIYPYPLILRLVQGQSDLILHGVVGKFGDFPKPLPPSCGANLYSGGSQNKLFSLLKLGSENKAAAANLWNVAIDQVLLLDPPELFGLYGPG